MDCDKCNGSGTLSSNLDDLPIENRWYCVQKNGTIHPFYDEPAALRSAQDWPSLTASVVRLSGTIGNPSVETIWKNTDE